MGRPSAIPQITPRSQQGITRSPLSIPRPSSIVAPRGGNARSSFGRVVLAVSVSGGISLVLSFEISQELRITPQIHREGHQAGAIKPVRRAGWVWTEAALQLQGAARARCTCAGARKTIPLSHSMLRGFPQSCLPQAMRRVAAHRSAISGPGKRVLCQPSPLPI